jgi:hypothetical protein
MTETAVMTASNKPNPAPSLVPIFTSVAFMALLLRTTSDLSK